MNYCKKLDNTKSERDGRPFNSCRFFKNVVNRNECC